ncbi:MAG: cell division protein ZapE [Gammaproteobacteria bacterium]|nr:cell division protein ZapE [Gammaproteobacteria bacterium]
MTPAENYQQQLDREQRLPDPAQAEIIAALDQLYHRLKDAPNHKPARWQALFARKLVDQAPEQGLYLWGGVGRGKTWLMDLFYNLVSFEQKRRYHFHEFMQQIHQRLAALKGQSDPLELIAAEEADQLRLICLDEFIVSDIGDAMILAGLLKGLFRRGVTLVTTSNTPPHQLYQDGIQRASFLPAIDLLKRHTHIQELKEGIDYRTRYLEHAQVYHTPLGEGVDDLLTEEFESLAPEEAHQQESITIAGRVIPVRLIADDVVWFDFIALCGPPRSQMDYLELARRFHTVLISDIPVLGPALDDVTRRFLYLLDEFYDCNVKLILSAAAPAINLYQGERLAFDFQRGISRLHEMQSLEYLAKPHKP